MRERSRCSCCWRVATALCRAKQNSRDLQRLWIMVALALVPLLCWKVACARSGIQSNLAETGIWERLTTRLLRPMESAAIAEEMLFRLEIILPLCLLLICRRVGSAKLTLWFPGLVSGIYSSVIALVYLSTPSDLSWHLRTSASRTVLPVAMLLSFVCVLQVWSIPGANRILETSGHGDPGR